MLPPKKVLIVEDERPIAQALVFKFTQAGYDTKSVADGQAGVEVLERETFDIILLDLVMPRMDGFQFLAELQARKIQTPVIVLTNLSQAEDEIRVRASGACDYFIKSNIPIARLLLQVKRILNLE